MKIVFVLDMTDDKGQIVVPNGRVLELTPEQLQLRQNADVLWLVMPCDEKGNHVKGETRYSVNLVPFPGASLLVKPVEAPKPVAKKRKAVAKKTSVQ